MKQDLFSAEAVTAIGCGGEALLRPLRDAFTEFARPMAQLRKRSTARAIRKGGRQCCYKLHR